MSELGIVIIGRNEGERLHRCLNSVVGRGYTVVYVDSGSTDGSIELAQTMGAEVAQLDLSQPFTMARGRNLGFSSCSSSNRQCVSSSSSMATVSSSTAGSSKRIQVIESRPDDCCCLWSPPRAVH